MWNGWHSVAFQQPLARSCVACFLAECRLLLELTRPPILVSLAHCEHHLDICGP